MRGTIISPAFGAMSCNAWEKKYQTMYRLPYQMVDGISWLVRRTASMCSMAGRVSLPDGPRRATRKTREGGPSVEARTFCGFCEWSGRASIVPLGDVESTPVNARSRR